MQQSVSYYYFGPQCFGYMYMEEQAKKLAKYLGYSYTAYDLSVSQVSKNIRLYFPGNIMIGDFTVVYPGSVEQLEQSYALNGPIRHKWEPIVLMEWNC